LRRLGDDAGYFSEKLTGTFKTIRSPEISGGGGKRAVHSHSQNKGEDHHMNPQSEGDADAQSCLAV
jgi:hypothetical protein